jgi:branched-chain amino acid transport system substrate-binding protein
VRDACIVQDGLRPFGTDAMKETGMNPRRMVAVCFAIGLTTSVAACSSSSKSSTGGNLTTTTKPVTAPGPNVTGTPIVIGSVGTYTQQAGGGGGTSVGLPAIQAWASWVNSHGGVNGHPVKLIVKDNHNDQAQAVSDVKELVEQDHVIAFVSNQDGSLNAGYADYLKQKGIPVLGGNVFTLDPWISNPMFFPEGLTAIPQLNSLMASAKSQGYTKVGSLACSEAAQCAAANGLMKGLAAPAGVEYAYGGLVSSTAADYTASCLAAQGKGVQAFVLLVATADEGQQIADDCAQQNFTPAYVIPGEAIGAGYLKSKNFNNAYNNAPTEPWFSTDPSMNNFNTAMSQYAKVDLDTADEPLLATDAWVSGLMFQQAVKLSGAKGIPTTANILAGLSKFKNETLGGMAGGLTFTNPTSKNEFCYFTIVIKDQKFTLPNGAKPQCVASS